MLKRCPKCEIEKPRTAEYFYRNKSRPDGLHAACKACENTQHKTDEYKAQRKLFRQTPGRIEYQKEYAKQYQQTEKYKSYQRAYEKSEKRKAYKEAYEETPQRKAYHKEYRDSDEGKLYQKEYQKIYKQSAKYKSYQRSYNRSEAAKMLHRKYHQTEKGRFASLVQKHRRRAREVFADGDYTQEQWLELCALYGYKCLACHEEKPLTVDHVVPLSKGGSNYISNIQPLCLGCNTSKGTRIIDYRYLTL